MKIVVYRQKAADGERETGGIVSLWGKISRPAPVSKLREVMLRWHQTIKPCFAKHLTKNAVFICNQMDVDIHR